MSKTPVWVIAIAYDYGVVEQAGYFDTEEHAQAWIDETLKEEWESRKRFVKSLPEDEQEEWKETHSEKYYAVKLEPWYKTQ